jgi:putative transposase
MFNRAIRGQRWLPKYLSSDNDPLYRFHQWQANLRVLEVTDNKLLDFRTYFNNHRTHTSLEGRTPDTPASRPVANLRSFRWQPHCRALYQTPVAA